MIFEPSYLVRQTTKPNKLSLVLHRNERRTGQPRMWKTQGLSNRFKFPQTRHMNWEVVFVVYWKSGLFMHQILTIDDPH